MSGPRRAPASPPVIPGYTYVRHLGSGGYSDVFEYTRTQPPLVPRAIKVLLAAEADSEAFERFRAEADTMASVDHPNIAQVLDTGTAPDGRPYLVMKVYDRPDLAAQAKAQPFGVAEVLRVGVQIAGAVETAHRAGVVHRDIKPANLLADQYAPKLTDFGIAAVNADAAVAEALSVPWSPPEVVTGEGADARSDVYSLAATLFTLLVGRSPFEVRGGDNSTAALMQRIQSVPPPATGRADVPASLERLLHTAMAKRPEGRPATAFAFALALRAVEQELRLPPTDLLVADQPRIGPRPAPQPDPSRVPQPGPSRVPGREPGKDDATRLRPARPVEHTDPEDTAERRGRRRERVMPSRPPVPDTARAVVVPQPDLPERARPAEGPASRPRRAIGVGAAAVVVLAAAVGAAAAFGGAGDRPTGHGGAAEPPPQDAVPTAEQAVPTPAVTWRRTGPRSIVFTWTYPSRAAGDYVKVRRLDGDQRGLRTALGGAWPVTVAPGEHACLEVTVYRRDGRGSEPPGRACAS